MISNTTMAIMNCRILSKSMLQCSNYSSLISIPLWTLNASIFEQQKVLRRSYSFKSRSTLSDFIVKKLKDEKFLALDVSHVAKEDVEKTLEPYYYQITIPNERIGYDMIKGFNYWINIPSDVLEIVQQIWVSEYDAAIILDDLIDKSAYRRTTPSSNKLFGNSHSVLSSLACFFLIMKKLMTLKNDKVMELYVDTILQYSVGVTKEVLWKRNKICPTLLEFEKMSIDKTYPLVMLPIQLMQNFSDCKTDFTELTTNLSLFLQYITDVSNLWDEKTRIAKGFCDDFAEGKFTLAGIHAVQSGTLEGRIVHNIISSKTMDLTTQKYCLSLLEKLGSFDFAKNTTKSVENKVRGEIERLGGNPILVKFIDDVICHKHDEIYPETENT